MGFWRGLGNLVTGGTIDRSEAKDTIESANWFMERAQQSLEEIRKSTETCLADYGTLRLKVAAGSLKEFEALFSQFDRLEKTHLKQHDNNRLRNLPNIDIAGISQVSVTASEALGVLGAGAVSGVAAYAGAMGLAGLIGTASTGTAIGALSGAAATNATLAWLGGGALSAGGAGMAGGMMVLGGIAVVPFALILGGIGAYKAQQQLNEAENYYDRVMVEIEKMKTLGAELGQIQRGAELLSQLIYALSELLNVFNSGIKGILEKKELRDNVFNEQLYQAEQIYQEERSKRKKLNLVVRFFANIFKPVRKTTRKVIVKGLGLPLNYLKEISYFPEEERLLMNSFNTADLLFKILNIPLMGEDGAFLSEPVNLLQNGTRDIIDVDSTKGDKIKAIENLNELLRKD